VPFFLSRGSRAPLVFNFSTAGMRSGHGQRGSRRDQDRTNDCRYAFTVTGLHVDVYFPGFRSWRTDSCDAWPALLRASGGNNEQQKRYKPHLLIVGSAHDGSARDLHPFPSLPNFRCAIELFGLIKELLPRCTGNGALQNCTHQLSEIRQVGFTAAAMARLCFAN
jgi:hypothetical protein